VPAKIRARSPVVILIVLPSLSRCHGTRAHVSLGVRLEISIGLGLEGERSARAALSSEINASMG
jgi:hypothetical protein